MTKVITFGCRLNFYESDLIKDFLSSNNGEEIIVINTCAVTNEAERQVKQRIRRCHREDPNKKIIVVGCGVQLDPEGYLAIPGVFKVLGNIEKLQLENYKSEKRILVGDISAVDKDISRRKAVSPILSGRTRSFLEIQNGCDHDCTFCAITLARGKNRSVPVEVLIAEVREMAEAGVLEVVLTGVDITDYGKDLFGKPSLSYLIRAILDNVPELPRLRLSSVDVAELDDEFIGLFVSEPRLMPHIHLSLQSGDEMILKRMKRRHNLKQIRDFYSRVSSLRSVTAFGADIIAGFPTETEEMFLNTYRLIEELAIPYLHVFPFSPKKGTKAALMPQVDESIRKRRAKQLIELGKKKLREFYEAQIGQVHNVVLERDNIGRSENFSVVKLDHAVEGPSTLKVRINSCNSDMLIGQII
ncbi:radical SAM methylthiotransferase, MiaB/RimO family protein [Neorickettsia helminthoeca str. Oregon]|uniref:Radical SAM methylthiotransferase, MiaB/RimO family protein n=1 Tax=Neorickettsia helminthoeca str. Oregon TaxID=1286528 RepID=X5HKT1_9RICK|nr:tRNA (N(6)-L-threonylcarbamoyladenosine(37)-C(2))-methylthiotransferase MtaB [Neorickettsia helminthoeca]AHX11674.1 radical SAM methylthiotransferase, MiaB/RimO family protein [Neorickettsia helminthoeca str. Oregon]